MTQSTSGPSYKPRIKLRVRTMLRTRVSEYPRVYLPFARRKYPGPSPDVVEPGIELVIDGYTRSASTYAVYALQLAQRHPVRMAHHLHAAAQVVQAVRWQIPTLVLIREPRDAVLSQVVREPGVAVRDCLASYVRYHQRLLPHRQGFVAADFEEVTHNFPAVVEKLNARFGLHLELPTAEASQEVFEFVGQRARLSPVLLGFESGLVGKEEARQELAALARLPSTKSEQETWIPSSERQRAKEALISSWERPALAALRTRAQELYRTLLDLSESQPRARSVAVGDRDAV